MIRRAALLAERVAPSRFPVVWFGVLSIAGYAYHVGHEPWPWIIALVVPVALLNVILASFGRRRISAIYASGPQLADIVFVFAASTIFCLLELLRWSIWTVPAVVFLLLWILLRFRERAIGSFLVGAAGILAAVLVVSSFRLLNLLEEKSFVVRHAIAVREMEAADPILWRKQSENGYVLEHGGYRLAFTLPSDLFFHPASSFTRNYEIPAVGRPLAAISSSIEDPTTAPTALFFEGTSSGGLHDSDASGSSKYRVAFETLLGHLVNEARMQDPNFEGGKVLNDPVIPVRWEGMQWTYTETSSTRRMRTGVYTSDQGGRWIVMIYRDPVAAGFRHHPDMLRLLQGVRIDRSTTPQ